MIDLQLLIPGVQIDTELLVVLIVIYVGMVLKMGVVYVGNEVIGVHLTDQDDYPTL